MIPILVSYNMISYTYKYEIHNNQISFSTVDDGIPEKRLVVTKNQYSTCVDEWLEKESTAIRNSLTNSKKKFPEKKSQKNGPTWN